MKFLGDAHLPLRLCAVLQEAGHDAIHTSQLTAHNRTPDEIINQISLAEERVVVTKDSDFYHSHLRHGSNPYGVWPCFVSFMLPLAMTG